ncbi:hypothetical protein D3C71_2173070 [compost metagenome]
MQCLEIARPVVLADGLDHLDGADMVELPLCMPIILENQGGVFVQTLPGQALEAELELLGR